MKFRYLELFSELLESFFGYLEPGHDYAISVMSYLDVCAYFGMFGTQRPLAILWYQLGVSRWFYFQVHRGSNHPIGKTL